MTSQLPYMFPSHFDGIENKDDLITASRVMCIKSRFNLILRISKSQMQLSQSHASYISLCCEQCVVYRDQRKDKERRTNTQWCINSDENCNFWLNIFLYKELNKMVFIKEVIKMGNI